MEMEDIIFDALSLRDVADDRGHFSSECHLVIQSYAAETLKVRPSPTENQMFLSPTRNSKYYVLVNNFRFPFFNVFNSMQSLVSFLPSFYPTAVRTVDFRNIDFTLKDLAGVETIFRRFITRVIVLRDCNFPSTSSHPYFIVSLTRSGKIALYEYGEDNDKLQTDEERTEINEKLLLEDMLIEDIRLLETLNGISYRNQYTKMIRTRAQREFAAIDEIIKEAELRGTTADRDSVEAKADAAAFDNYRLRELAVVKAHLDKLEVEQFASTRPGPGETFRVVEVQGAPIPPPQGYIRAKQYGH